MRERKTYEQLRPIRGRKELLFHQGEGGEREKEQHRRPSDHPPTMPKRPGQSLTKRNCHEAFLVRCFVRRSPLKKEMRWRLTHRGCRTRKVIARTNGMPTATTTPARTPRLTKLTSNTIRTASPSARVK